MCNLGASDEHSIGRGQPDFMARCREHGGDESSGGRLAVGAGDQGDWNVMDCFPVNRLDRRPRPSTQDEYTLARP